MLGADAGVARVDDFSLTRNEAAQKLHFLVIYFLGILGTKKALFG